MSPRYRALICAARSSPPGLDRASIRSHAVAIGHGLALSRSVTAARAAEQK
jgi:hypothetical protein